MSQPEENSVGTTMRTSHVKSNLNHHVETEEESLLLGSGNKKSSKMRSQMNPMYMLVGITCGLAALVAGCYHLPHLLHLLRNQVTLSVSTGTLRHNNNENHQNDGFTIESGLVYTATQFISFTINTFGGFAEHGECQGRDVDDGVCYLGNWNLAQDVQHRLELLLDVLDTLKDDIRNHHEDRIDHRDNVLKIFMLPEFYFRGPNGACTLSSLSEGKRYLSFTRLTLGR
jgi:hypothetical protein